MHTTIANAIEHPVDKAARLLGGRSAMAESLDVSVAAIGNWKTRGVPAAKCPLIERVTNGVVRCELLRPDVEWGYIRTSNAIAPANSAQPAAENVAQGVANA